MLGACRLNNKSTRAIRREATYQTMAIDLAMLGVITKEECEMLIGCGIPKGLVLPNGKAGNLVSEKCLPEQPDFIQTETGDTETGDTETGDTETGDTETGDTETGDTETGDTETGDTETGDTETGDTETGDTETGDTETGDVDFPDGTQE